MASESKTAVVAALMDAARAALPGTRRRLMLIEPARSDAAERAA